MTASAKDFSANRLVGRVTRIASVSIGHHSGREHRIVFYVLDLDLKLWRVETYTLDDWGAQDLAIDRQVSLRGHIEIGGDADPHFIAETGIIMEEVA